MSDDRPATQVPGGGNLWKGKPDGVAAPRKKRNVEGEEYARDVLIQDDEDILTTKVEHDITGLDGKPKVVTTEVEMDRHPKAIADPVFRVLRRQARCGVGNVPGQLPPAVFSSLSDRAFGKVVDKVKTLGGARPYASESSEQLRERLREKLTMLDGGKAL